MVVLALSWLSKVPGSTRGSTTFHRGRGEQAGPGQAAQCHSGSTAHPRPQYGTAQYSYGTIAKTIKCELDSLHASEAWDEGLEWESYQFGRTSTVFSKSAGLRARAGVVLLPYHRIISIFVVDCSPLSIQSNRMLYTFHTSQCVDC